ncbi:MAG: protein kinase [Planctomycetes bacterium]|nr:protein kinase [Planctomycetota bacterium]
MPHLDATSLAQLALRQNLITDEEWRDCRAELDPANATPEGLLRIFERKAYLTPWQGAKLLKGDTDGYFLGGYRLLYRISAGSFGRVYRADNPQTGEVVAIKVLRRKWSDDKHKIELFEREGKVGLSLRHPNIVQILAVSRDPASGQYFIVMEFVEGGNLRDILNIRKKMDGKDALRIMEEAASGLAYSWSRGLTHRDIKPTNILLSARGEAKLVDFGLAEISTAAAGDDDEANVDRTVDYAGLEKATGVAAGDVRSDIYFLGCTLFEMMTGKPLLSVTKNAKARMSSHRFETADLLKQDDPDLPAPIFSLLRRMVAFNPNERVQTPALLVDAVRQAAAELRGEPIADLASAGPKTVFVIEHHPKLQDVFRDKLKRMGYRVLISIDANRAYERFVQQPYQALIIDAGTAGEDGLAAMERVLGENKMRTAKCSGILILSEEQATWRDRAVERLPGATILVRPVTMKQITEVLRREVPVPTSSGE